MKKLYFFLSLLFLLSFSQKSWGQIKLGNNPETIDPTALLELDSSTKGLLLPRMTSAQRDAIPMATNPVGLLIYNTDIDEIQYLYEATVTNAKGEKRQELRWESVTDNTIPFTRPTSPALGQLFYDTTGEQLNIWNGSAWVIVGGNTATSGGATTTISYQNLTLVGTQLSISNGNTVDLSSIVSATGPQGPQGPSGPQGSPATDDQTLTTSALSSNNTLTIAISGGNTQTLDLSNLAKSGTDSQTLSVSALSANNTVTFTISGGNSQTLDLSPLAAGGGTGTDSQTLSVSALSANNTVTLAISGGNTETLDLSSIAPTGLVSVTENGDMGYRLALEPTANHGDIGGEAVDLSIQRSPSSVRGATHNYAFASGRDTEASGLNSTALGYRTIASNTFSTAIGFLAEALGESSIAMGHYITAESFGQTSLGMFSTALAGDDEEIVATDRLLVVGNGTGTSVASRTDALVMLKNGNTTLNGALTLNPTGTSSYTLPTEKGTNGQVLSMLDASTGTTTWTSVAAGGGSGTDSQTLSISALSANNTVTFAISGGNTDTLDLSSIAPTGLVSVTENGNSGYRLNLVPEANYGNIGSQAVDLSIQTAISSNRGSTGLNSVAMGRNVTAQGFNSTAMGSVTSALGAYSTAMGYITTASGSYSTAMGGETTASGDYSTAMGEDTTASGEYSTAMGQNTTASGNHSTAMGNSTTASGTYTTAMGGITVASGQYSTAMGRNTTSESYGQTTLGYFNTPHPGTPFTEGIVFTDRLFVIGKGVSSSTRSDALVMLKNGDTQLNGNFTVDGSISQTGTGVLHADYVFESYYDGVSEYNKNYSLPSLEAVEVFVRKNKHLPGVQSRADIMEKGNWNITENVRTNLEKVEELYLHTIEQQKQLGAQQEQLAAQQKEIETLKAMIIHLMERE